MRWVAPALVLAGCAGGAAAPGPELGGGTADRFVVSHAGGESQEVDDVEGAGHWTATSTKRAVAPSRAHASSSKPNNAAGKTSITSSSMCAASS